MKTVVFSVITRRGLCIWINVDGNHMNMFGVKTYTSKLLCQISQSLVWISQSRVQISQSLSFFHVHQKYIRAFILGYLYSYLFSISRCVPRANLNKKLVGLVIVDKTTCMDERLYIYIFLITSFVYYILTHCEYFVNVRS